MGAGLVGLLAEWLGIQAAFAVSTVATLVLVVPFLRTVAPATLAEVPVIRN